MRPVSGASGMSSLLNVCTGFTAERNPKYIYPMKRTVIYLLAASVLVSGCGTYAGAGAYTGSTLGSMLGSAIGGIADGPRGSDIGTIFGMAGGAIVGGAIGAQADKQREEAMMQRRADMQAQRNTQQRQYDYRGQGINESGFDATNSGDDIIYDFNGQEYTGTYSAQQPTQHLPANSSIDNLATSLSYAPQIEIRNARFVDDNQDNAISRGELCKVIFEVHNTGNGPLFDVQPSVVESTGNKHIAISPGLHVERILPGQGIRYTALVKADKRLREGSARFCLSVLQGNRAISKVTEFNVPTKKK